MNAPHTPRPLSTVERVMLARLADKWACMSATPKEIERYQALYDRDRATAKATGGAA